MATEADRRRHRRFDLSFPVQVRVKTQATPQVQTSTKDISARGIYFTMSQDCELGSELECVVTLPPEFCQGHTVQVRCRGKVVRVERPDAKNRIGVAATIEDYEFVKTD